MKRRRKACALTCCSAFVHSSHACILHTPKHSIQSLTRSPALMYVATLRSSTWKSCSTENSTALEVAILQASERVMSKKIPRIGQ